jgi:hypothetical protein
MRCNDGELSYGPAVNVGPTSADPAELGILRPHMHSPLHNFGLPMIQDFLKSIHTSRLFVSCLRATSDSAIYHFHRPLAGS